MLHFFTDPYKDELIYSAIARYHFYCGNTDFKDTLEECFGKRTIVPTLEIGGNIDYLAKELGGKYLTEYLINKHTILPYYRNFIDVEKYEEIVNEIRYVGCASIYNKLGIIAGGICKKDYICYCPICSKYEIKTYGEAFIHREHQLQGILICAHHGIWLEEYPVNKNQISKIEFIKLDVNLLKLNIKQMKIDHYEKLLKLAKDAYYLLELDLNNIDKRKVLQRYKALLYEKGLAISSKTIKQTALYNEFIKYYGEDLLQLLQSQIDNENEYNWLRVITRDSNRAVHPIRHILLINFLTEDIQRFFNQIHKSSNIIRSSPRSKNNYDINDVNINKYNIYKENIINILVNNKDINRKNLRELCKKEYTYMYRYDKEWLFSNLPNKSIGVSKNKRVDWDIRDEEYLILLKKKYKELLLNSKPIRITKGNLAKPLGILVNVEKKIKNIPKTEKFLSEVCETIQEFQIRRCKNIIDNMNIIDYDIKIWKVQRAAGIRKNDFDIIRDVVAMYMKNIVV